MISVGPMQARDFFVFPLLLTILSVPTVSFAQSSLLVDKNGDGVVSILAFGDSITYGIGDSPRGGGFPARVSTLVGVPVENEGVPGERLLGTGEARFPSELIATTADIVLVTEGANDANERSGITEYRNALQKIINVSRALGREVVLGAPQKPVAEHESLGFFTDSYAQVVRDLAVVNEISVADFQRAWASTCDNQTNCNLYNLPEGLHPNSTGYTVMAQTVASSLLGINIFADGGAAELEGALNLPAGSVLVKPEVSTSTGQ